MAEVVNSRTFMTITKQDIRNLMVVQILDDKVFCDMAIFVEGIIYKVFERIMNHNTPIFI